MDWRGGSGYPMAINFQFANVHIMKRKRNEAASHARKSGQRQDDSTAAQMKAIRRHAHQHGFKIVKMATDGES